MRPMDVKKENQEQEREVMYGNGTRETIKSNFKVGDSVRISKRKGIFEKGYTPNWTQQVFKIEKRLPRIPPIYKIKDLLNETQKGIFYEKQLQFVSKEEIYLKLDTILRTQVKSHGEVEKFVSWLGYKIILCEVITQISINILKCSVMHIYINIHLYS
jgi:hypothetical protein